MDYLMNCSITKTPFNSDSEIILIPSFFLSNIYYTSNIDRLVYQIPLIIEAKYSRHGIYDLKDNEKSKFVLNTLNDLIKTEQSYNWIDFHEFFKNITFYLNGEDYIFQFFAINKIIFNQIIKNHKVIFLNEKLDFNSFKDKLKSNFDFELYKEKYYLNNLNFDNYFFEDIAKIEFIKNYMKITGIVIQPTFMVQEYNANSYNILLNSMQEIIEQNNIFYKKNEN